MIRHPIRRAAAALAVLAALAACDSARSPLAPEVSARYGEKWCTMELRYAVAAQVVGPPASFVPEESWMIVRDGEYVDSATFLTYYDSQTGEPVYIAAAAEEREGIYSVTVRSPGFREWTREGVRVKGDRCHVTSQWVFPVLVPLGG